MARVLVPQGPRSPTAMAGRSDLLDQPVYTAICLGHGGSGQGKVFTVPQGQTIPTMSSVAAATFLAAQAAHQKTYTALTTNLTQAGQLGSALGDVSVRSLGITIETATPVFAGGAGAGAITAVQQYAAAGAVGSVGGTPQEVNEILHKTTFLFRVGGKKQIEGPTYLFPNMGGVGMDGALTTTASTLAFARNGQLGAGGRKSKLPLLVARTDTIEGEVNIPATALTFRDATNGSPTLVWYTLQALARGDVR